MEDLIFACVSSSMDIRTLFFVASLRKYAGNLSDNPVYIVVPKSEDKLPNKYVQHLLSLEAKVLAFTPDSNLGEFPFAKFVQAAATAEAFAKENDTVLAWLTPDTLILNPPTHFLIDQAKKLAYRPVHHTLIGSLYDKPIDSFWQLIYKKCGVSKDNIFPMRTHVDDNVLRPYFNAGCLIIRPEEDLFHLWLTKFKELYQHPRIQQYYDMDARYRIFIHQVVLAGVIISSLKKEDMVELPFTYNYPLHLYSESESKHQPKDVNALITARYEDIKMLNTIPFNDPLKSWIKKQKQSFALESK